MQTKKKAAKSNFFKTKDVKTWLAGAGCGKTYSLMDELKLMLKKYRPDEIAFVSFSRKAASEVRNRAELLGLDYSPDDFPYFRTLHSLCYMLNEYTEKGKSIINKDDAALFAKVTNMTFSIHDRQEGNRIKDADGQKFFDMYALERATGKEPDNSLIFPRLRYKEFKDLYILFKEKARVIDYHDCLTDYLKDGEAISKIKVAFIDEAQDLTIQQWQVCFKAFESAKHVRIAGDDWQSIFAFQGAAPKFFIDVAQSGEIIKLEESYRLPKSVTRLAEKIVGTIDNKIDKHCLTKKELEGEIGSYTEFDYIIPLIEASVDDTWYLLLRLNFQIQKVTEILKSHTILFHYTDSFCLPEKYLLKLRQFYKWSDELLSPSDEITFCKKNWIKATEDGGWPLWWHTNLIPNPKMRETFRQYEEKFGFDVLWRASIMPPRILVTTIFKVKGGEADRVVVFTSTSRKVEEGRLIDRDNEARVMYTSVTRAKKAVYFTGLKGCMDSDYIRALL